MEILENIKKQISELTKAKKFNEAKELANSWIEKENTNSMAYNTLAHVHIMAKELDDAKSAINKSIELSPDEPASRFTLGRIEFAKNEIALAQKAFEKCIEICKALNWDYYTDSAKLSQAQCLVLQGEKEEAIFIASEIDPSTSVWLGGYITPEKIISNN